MADGTITSPIQEFEALKDEVIRLKLVNAELLEALKSVSKCNRTQTLPVQVVIKMMEAIDKASPYKEESPESDIEYLRRRAG